MTVDAAAEQLVRLNRMQGSPVNVLAWSFGSRLAVELSRQYPAETGTLTLLAPVLCLRTAYWRMATTLLGEGHGGESLQTALSQVQVNSDAESQLALVMAILTIPDFMRHYWSPGNETLCAHHQAEATKTSWFDLPTFTAVAREAFDTPVSLHAIPIAHTVRILAGRHDPYFDPDTDPETWRTLFPEAQITITDAGHMLPFEQPVADWLMT
jgi:pimeloyl-ACP methyl ester carboxylesterase